MDISGVIEKIVPITLFNKGKASQQFSRVKNGETLVVVKNNVPVAIMVSPEEYILLQQLSKAYEEEAGAGRIGRAEKLDVLVNKLKQFG